MKSTIALFTLFGALTGALAAEAPSKREAVYNKEYHYNGTGGRTVSQLRQRGTWNCVSVNPVNAGNIAEPLQLVPCEEGTELLWAQEWYLDTYNGAPAIRVWSYREDDIPRCMGAYRDGDAVQAPCDNWMESIRDTAVQLRDDGHVCLPRTGECLTAVQPDQGNVTLKWTGQSEAWLTFDYPAV